MPRQLHNITKHSLLVQTLEHPVQSEDILFYHCWLWVCTFLWTANVRSLVSVSWIVLANMIFFGALLVVSVHDIRVYIRSCEPKGHILMYRPERLRVAAYTPDLFAVCYNIMYLVTLECVSFSVVWVVALFPDIVTHWCTLQMTLAFVCILSNMVIAYGYFNYVIVLIIMMFDDTVICVIAFVVQIFWVFSVKTGLGRPARFTLLYILPTKMR